MATISSAGIGSGLDINGIITQLMAIERKPLDALNSEETDVKSQLSTFGKLQDFTATMRDRAAALTSLTLWGRTTGVSGDPSAVKISTANGAATGNYAVEVQALAAGQTVSSRAFTSATTAAFGPGTLTIELGGWTGSPTVSGFTPKDGAAPVTVTIGPEDDTLAKVRDKINAANAGVTATIINDASGARLAIRSKETGADNAFRITAAETADDGVATDGLSALDFSRIGTWPMGLNQTARNAEATVNGIAITSSSNKLANVADGVTLELLKTTTGAIDVAVAPDTEAVRTAVTDFAKAFNDLAGFIREQTKYDPTAKKGGPLQGDRAAIGLQNQLRAVLNLESGASSTFKRLSDIGLVMKSDGTLETKSSALENGLANLGELRKLFAADDATNAASGFMTRFKRLGDAALGTDGTFETRNSSLKDRISRLDKRQEQLQNRLEQTEKRLRAQYQALDENMARLNGLSGYVSAQLQALSNGSRR
jgi:flagellar hook-associated protein 2